jgi:hypothetical protein
MNHSDFNQIVKNRIFESANNKDIFIRYQGKKYPAKLYGRLLDFPVISEAKENGLQTEINWFIAQRLAEKIIDTVLID